MKNIIKTPSKAKRPDESYKTTKLAKPAFPARAKRDSSVAMVAIRVTDMLDEEVLMVKAV